MSLFEGLDVASASDDPWGVSVGWHKTVITKCEVKPTAKGDKKGVNWAFQVTEGADKGSTHTDWQWVPAADDHSDEAERAKKFLKQRMVKLGIPQDRINQVEPSDMVGIEPYIEIKEAKSGNRFIAEIKLDAPPAGTLSAAAAPAANPFD